MAAQESENNEADVMTIRIKTLVGVAFNIEVLPTTTVLEMKQQVQEKQNIAIHVQKLMSIVNRKKVVLEDTQIAADLGFKNKQMVWLAQKMSKMTLWDSGKRYVYERNYGTPVEVNPHMTIEEFLKKLGKENARKCLFYAFKTAGESETGQCVWLKCHHLSFNETTTRMQNNDKCFYGPLDKGNTLADYNVADQDSFWIVM